MNYLKIIGFIIGMIAWGATLQLSDLDSDSEFTGFVCYGFFAVAVLIAWGEVKNLVMTLKR
ncbi:MAG: hypothetical protein E7H57_12185 [Pantoea sp.]|nr:hypothetical protein [Pantoea sp.]